jgi:enediyne biosynthesis protein E4
MGTLVSIVPTRALDPVTFTDVTKESRITFSHVWSTDKKYILESMSGGVALFDFDNDGLLDVYLVNSPTVATAGDVRSARSELWRNQGDGTFIDVTDKAGVGYPGWGMGAVAADFDNDGWDDLYVACYGPNKLYRNNRDGTFSDVTAKAGVGDPRWSTGAALADYDGDGWLDLFVANYVDVRLDGLPEFGKGKFCEFHGIPVQCGPRGLPGSGDSLYHNKRDGTFEDVSKQAGVADPEGRFGMGAAWSDFDGDGRPDLYVANDAGPNYLYRNNGNGTFTDVALQAGTALSEDGKEQGSMGVAVGDYDHSAGWSIFVTNFADEYNALYHHDKAFQFTDASFASRTAKSRTSFVGWGTHFLDYDNDGWLDLLVVNGHVYPQVERAGPSSSYAQPKLLFHNDHNGTFSDVTSTSGAALKEPAVSRGSAAGDLDNDGDLDVVINNLDGAPTVLRNLGGNRQNFLVVDLEGRTDNRSAVGAIVTVRTGDLVQHAERRSGDSYLSHSDARLHFGLGERTRVDSIEVRWPSGTVQRFGGPATNTFVKIVQGSPELRVVRGAANSPIH